MFQFDDVRFWIKRGSYHNFGKYSSEKLTSLFVKSQTDFGQTKLLLRFRSIRTIGKVFNYKKYNKKLN